ncbi:MAG: LolA-like protein [Thermoleophilia bacterium]
MIGRTGFSRKTALLLMIIGLMLPITAGLGCNDRETKTYPIWQPDQAPPARTYSTSPESTSELLRDASQAVKVKTAANLGVHFTEQSTGAIDGQTAGSRAEGDILFPDKVQMVTRDYLSPAPLSTDVIVTSGQTFIRSEATGGVWKTGASPSLPPDPELITGYLDFARSSRNFGQETLSVDIKTYHLQVDVDMPLLAAGLMKTTNDPEQLKKFEAMKAAVVTVDFWIDEDSRLIDQMLVKSSNQPQGQNLEQKFIFSNWGKAFEIVRPCETC